MIGHFTLSATIVYGDEGHFYNRLNFRLIAGCLVTDIL